MGAAAKKEARIAPGPGKNTPTKSDLSLHDLNSVPVRIADGDALPETCLAIRQIDRAGGEECGFPIAQRSHRLVSSGAQEARVPVDQVVHPSFLRVGATVARRQILQKLDSRTRRRPQRGNSQAGPEYVVEPFLFRAEVLAFAGDLHPQAVAIEPQAGLGIGHDDRSVVDTQEQAFCRYVPLGRTLFRREPQDFERMAVRIAEVERLVLVAQCVRSLRVAETRKPAACYATGFGIAAVVWILSALLETPARYWCWTAALLIEFATPCLRPNMR
jgi:hypothetical protein